MTLKLWETVCQTIHHLLEYVESAFKDHFRCQPVTNCCEFRFLLEADLVPSTGYKINFLVK